MTCAKSLLVTATSLDIPNCTYGRAQQKSSRQRLLLIQFRVIRLFLRILASRSLAENASYNCLNLTCFPLLTLSCNSTSISNSIGSGSSVAVVALGQIPTGTDSHLGGGTSNSIGI